MKKLGTVRKLLKYSKNFMIYFLVIGLLLGGLYIDFPRMIAEAGTMFDGIKQLSSTPPGSVDGPAWPSGDPTLYRIVSYQALNNAPRDALPNPVSLPRTTGSVYYGHQNGNMLVDSRLQGDSGTGVVSRMLLNAIFSMPPYMDAQDWWGSSRLPSSVGNNIEAYLNPSKILSYIASGMRNPSNSMFSLTSTEMEVAAVLASNSYWKKDATVSTGGSFGGLASGAQTNMGPYLFYGPINVGYDSSVIRNGTFSGASVYSESVVTNAANGNYNLGSPVTTPTPGVNYYVAISKASIAPNFISIPEMTVTISNFQALEMTLAYYSDPQGRWAYVSPYQTWVSVAPITERIPVTNAIRNLSVQVRDAATGAPISGAGITLNAQGWVYNDTGVTGDEVADSWETKILPGTYTVNCDMSATDYVLTGAQPSSVTVTSTPSSGNASVIFYAEKKAFSETFTLLSSVPSGNVLGSTGSLPIKGAIFALYKGGVKIAQYTTDTNGQFTITQDAGAYRLVQIYTPDKYYLSSKEADFSLGDHVVLNPADSDDKNWVNLIKVGTVSIIQRETGTLIEVQNIKFDIYRNGVKIGTGQSAGASDTFKVEPGIYTIQPTIAPSGYLLGSPFGISVVADNLNVVSPQQFSAFVSRKHGGIKVTVKDDLGNPVPGALLKLTPPANIDNPYPSSQAYRTNAEGYFMFSGLPTSDTPVVAQYTVELVRESIAEMGKYYIINLSSESARTRKKDVIADGTVYDVSFDNIILKRLNLSVNEVWEGTSTSVDGTVIGLYHSNGVLVGTRMLSSGSSPVTWNDLLYDNYYVRVITQGPGAAADFNTYQIAQGEDSIYPDLNWSFEQLDPILDTPMPYEVTKTIYAKKLTGGITIYTLDQWGNPYSGATYSISTTGSAPWVILNRSDPTIYPGMTFVSRNYGTYFIRCESIDDSALYTMDTTVKTAEITSTEVPVVLYFTVRSRATNSATIIKRDKISGAPIQGAIFGMFKYNTTLIPVTTATTDAQGEAKFTNIPNGSYYFREIKPANGYTHDKTLLGYGANEAAVAGVTLQQLLDAWAVWDSANGYASSVVAANTYYSNDIGGTPFGYASADAVTFSGGTNWDSESGYGSNISEGEQPNEEQNVYPNTENVYTNENLYSESYPISGTQNVYPEAGDTLTTSGTQYVNPDGTTYYYTGDSYYPAEQGSNSGIFGTSSIYVSVEGVKTSDAVTVYLNYGGSNLRQSTVYGEQTVKFEGLGIGTYTLSTNIVGDYIRPDNQTVDLLYNGYVKTIAMVFVEEEDNYITVKVNSSDSAGLSVILRDSKGKKIETGKTNSKGTVVFEELSLGTYEIELSTVPSGYQSPSNLSVKLTSKKNTDTVYFDLITNNGNVTGTVFWDRNYNGVLDSAEQVVKNVSVTLMQSGAVKAVTVTDAFGVYRFTSVLSGTYEVAVTAPSGYKFSTQPKINAGVYTSVSTSGKRTITLISGGSQVINAGMYFSSGVVLPNTGVLSGNFIGSIADSVKNMLVGLFR